MDRSYLNRTNLEYVENLMDLYQKNPENVDPIWQKFFEGVEMGQRGDLQLVSPLNGETDSTSSSDLKKNPSEFKVYELIQAYRDYGHLKANLDPLGLRKCHISFLEFKSFHLSESEVSQVFSVGRLLGLENKNLSEIIDQLEKWYCGTLAIQMAECAPEIRNWFTQQMESDFALSRPQKIAILKQLIRTETLEKFLHTRYVGMKRFSIEGCDSLIPCLEYLCEKGAEMGVQNITIGMAHRGRINVLANFMDKALEVIFSEFDGNVGVDHTNEYDGDVKYHLGFLSQKQTSHGSMDIVLAFNPSHLESASSVVLGMVRAEQRFLKDTQDRKTVVPILIHGDAAVIGQGVASETFQLSQLEGYTVGGAIHIILNNQVGFTTNPKDARSTLYPSDIAKTIKAPIVMANGDDPEACVRAMDMAIRFRQKFKQDVVIEIVGYRRFGHNEGDEPSFTQPVIYNIIKTHKTPYQKYADILHEALVFSHKDSKKFYEEKMENLQKILDHVRETPPEVKPILMPHSWKHLQRGSLKDAFKKVDTRTSKDHLEISIRAITQFPEGFSPHPKIKRLVDQRVKQWQEDTLDWGTTELLTYGSLLAEGSSIRLTGQDCIRGTFSHRHAVFFDKKTGEAYSPLKSINLKKECCIYNSPLSEFATLGFEYGNAIIDPNFLILWEAQFGDFANGAQIIIDQFLSSGESKWYQMNGLVLLLPHGYEGQGPEHSSARLERFLQLCAQYNMQVCNFTRPDQLFHALRRQVKRDFRKPMIIMSPKSLLRHPQVTCKKSDLIGGCFYEVIDDPRKLKPSQVQRVILCSGKIYYDLEASKLLSHEVALIRIEQIYPYPHEEISKILKPLTHFKELLWVQEEPKNMGSYHFMAPRLRQSLQNIKRNDIPVYYVGRTERASPATGSIHVHQEEQQSIIEQSLILN